MCQGMQKCILVLFNVIFFLAGLVPFVIGIIALASPDTISDIIKSIPGTDQIPDIGIDLQTLIKSAAIYMTVLGGAIGLVGFLGCCGAICKNKCLLGTYISFLLVFLAAEIAIIVLAIFFPSMLENWAQTIMYDGLKQFKDDIYINESNSKLILPNDAVSLAWHSLQFEARCCGVYNASDYSKFNWTHYQSKVVPVSCCAVYPNVSTSPPTSIVYTDFVDLKGCLAGNAENMIGVNTDDCYTVLHDLLTKSSYIVIGVFAGIMAIEIILIIFACCICQRDSEKS